MEQQFWTNRGVRAGTHTKTPDRKEKRRSLLIKCAASNICAEPCGHKHMHTQKKSDRTAHQKGHGIVARTKITFLPCASPEHAIPGGRRWKNGSARVSKNKSLRKLHDHDHVIKIIKLTRKSQKRPYGPVCPATFSIRAFQRGRSCRAVTMGAKVPWEAKVCKGVWDATLYVLLL